jgi:hypothetical protein
MHVTRENGSTDFDEIFFVVVKSTEGEIGYLNLSHSNLIQNGGALKSCLLRLADPVQRTGQRRVINKIIMKIN